MPVSAMEFPKVRAAATRLIDAGEQLAETASHTSTALGGLSKDAPPDTREETFAQAYLPAAAEALVAVIQLGDALRGIGVVTVIAVERFEDTERRLTEMWR